VKPALFLAHVSTAGEMYAACDVLGMDTQNLQVFNNTRFHVVPAVRLPEAVACASLWDADCGASTSPVKMIPRQPLANDLPTAYRTAACHVLAVHEPATAANHLSRPSGESSKIVSVFAVNWRES
jgi:hypothetical protein